VTDPAAPADWNGLQAVTAAAMRALDFDATARFGIPASQLMENAGEAVAKETMAFLLSSKAASKNVVVVCGRGANGGDGLVAARHLRRLSAKPVVFICPPKAGADYPELVRVNVDAARKAGVEVRELGAGSGLSDALASASVALDALLGTGSSGNPTGAIYHAVKELLAANRPVLAVDLPTGLDGDTGAAGDPCVIATVTLTLGLPKRGLLVPRARKYVGELKVLDIGYPPELIQEVRAA
jgi:NAD(P)H-hydrate epimerase